MSRTAPDCPMCKTSGSSVKDTRQILNGVRRRRECTTCGHRFMTVERVFIDTAARDPRDEKLDTVMKYIQQAACVITGHIDHDFCRPGRPKVIWTTEMDEALRAGRRDGMSELRLGEMIGVDAAVVARRRKELNLPRLKPWAGKRASDRRQHRKEAP